MSKNVKKNGNNGNAFIRYNGLDDTMNALILSKLEKLTMAVDADWHSTFFGANVEDQNIHIVFGLTDILDYYRPFHEEKISFQMSVEECASKEKSWEIQARNLAAMANYYAEISHLVVNASAEQNDMANQLFVQLTNKLFIRGTKNYSQVYPGFVSKLKNAIINTVHSGEKSKLKHLAPITEYHTY